MGEYDRKIGYANKQTAALEYRCGAVWVKLLNKDSFIFVFSRPEVLFDRTVLHARLDPVEGGDVYLRFFGGGLLGGLVGQRQGEARAVAGEGVGRGLRGTQLTVRIRA